MFILLAEVLVNKGGYDENEVIGYINQIRQRETVEMPGVEDLLVRVLDCQKTDYLRLSNMKGV